MRPMNGLGALAVAALTAWTFLGPAVGSWAFVAVEFASLAWLTREMRRTDAAALIARARAPLDADESDVVRRYAFYFTYPAIVARIGVDPRRPGPRHAGAGAVADLQAAMGAGHPDRRDAVRASRG